MPKEYVRGCFPVVGSPEHTEVEGLVSVGWNAETGHMQLATISRNAESYEVVNDGLYVDLDRRGINELIKNLRRARDQAFGRDE